MQTQQNKKKGRTARVILVAAVALAVIAGVYADLTTSTPVRIGRVRRGTMEQYVQERARTSLPHVHHLTMPEAGRVEPITLQEGDAVTNGQVVARLDQADLDDALTESKAVVTALANALKASMAQIQAAQARSSFNEWVWKAQEELYRQKLSSELDAKRAQTDYLTAQVAFEESQADAYSMEALLAASRLFPLYVKRQLRRTEIKAPIDGVVLKRYVWNERVMQPGEPLLDIGNLDDLEVTADILTQEAPAIRKGNPVEIREEAAGAVVVTGTVHRVNPMGFTKVSSLGVEQQRVPVTIRLDDAGKDGPLASIGLAYRLYVRVITARKADALIIPRTALFRGNDGRWKVYVVRGGKTAMATLELGLMNDIEAEVLEGLAEGDEVVIAPESSLKAGARVKASGA